jgi:CrcB protein
VFYNALAVGLGGFIGAIARYAMSGFILHRVANTRFPLGTLCVNVAGCFLIGLLSGVIEKWHVLPSHTRLFLITGLLGGFTTLSSFAFETLLLLRRGLALQAFFNITLTVALAMVAVWAGSRLGVLMHA